MTYTVKMPKLGLEMKTGTLSAWLVSEGDDVSEGDTIAEIESEKTTAEISAKEDGVIRRILLPEGESIAPGGQLAIIAPADADISDLEAAASGSSTAEASASESDESASAATPTPEASAESAAESGTGSESATAPSEVRASPRAKQLADEAGVDLTTLSGSGPQGAITESDVEAAAGSGGGGAAMAEPVRASPRAKKLADDLGVDLSTVEGTGPQGAISERDIEAAAETGTAESAATTGERQRVFAPPTVRRLARELGVKIERLEGTGDNGRITESDVRAAIGGQQEAGGTAAAEEIDPGVEEIEMERPLTGMRRTIADRLGQSYRESVHVTVNRSAEAEELLTAKDVAAEAFDAPISLSDLLLLATSAALDAHPEFNATFEDETHTLHAEHNICMAVDIDEGLVAPVVRDVDSLSLPELAERRTEVTRRAVDGTYSMDDLTGGTFTISNLGVLGVESFDPIINPPQIAILGVNTIEKRVVPLEDDGVGVKKHISFSLSFDHRIVDGADAARFLATLCEHVENPWPLVLAAAGR
ncbi:2-oxo acid dehydrogenase subunit E2 [Haloferax namakaokahaiae]|uniref:2-oxo acid dehydrogenase subunit E2 n=1 Tax=Haloferax namakaokahaiae TaxID=1748331 RepID=A0ABD5ZHU2_9EURY